MKLLGKAIVLLAVLLPLSAIPQTTEPLRVGTIAEIFLARAGADGKAGEAAQSFSVNDIPIYCVVRFTEPTVADVKMELVATSVPGVKSESKVVSIRYVTKENEDRVHFSGKPHGNWVPGKYRVDVFIADKKVRNIEFEIKASSTETANPLNVKPKAPSRKIVKRSSIAERYAS